MSPARRDVGKTGQVGFLGIVNPENDAVYLPVKKGRNELMLGLTELDDGWGFICRLSEAGR